MRGASRRSAAALAPGRSVEQEQASKFQKQGRLCAIRAAPWLKENLNIVFHHAFSLPRWDSGAAQNVNTICFLRRKENSAASGQKARPLRCPMFAYGFMSAAYFLQRQRKVTICALVQSASGLNVVLVVPLVMFSLTAHSTASA